MSLVKDKPDDNGYYLPHHAVFKESSNTTKIRVVFDASAVTNNGLSLNDALMTGPTIQDTLFSHLIRFRSYKYVLTADIEKMYRQVLLHKDDRRYQRILWRRNDKIETYELNTLTFGITSSPFLAIRTVQQLANDERVAFPRGAEVIKTHLYVDDLLTGANTLTEAHDIRNQVIALLARGGFFIRQWASNEARLIDDLDTDCQHAKFVFASDTSVKTLGISWNMSDDKICYSIRPIKIPDKITKRNLLSDIAKIFDPLGLLGPIVLYAKKLMQDIWRSGVSWDESISQNIYTAWIEFAQQLNAVEQFSIHRRLFADEYQDVQIHGFCDASQNGYGAVIYMRSVGKHGIANVNLLCAKSRVAPLKPVTIPRLELCGALLLARLLTEINHMLKIPRHKIICWSDSTTVLQWIKTPSHRLKIYVANRVAEIQALTDTTNWRHIRTADNPADALSRGQTPRMFLRNHLWLSGPSWLVADNSEWPNNIVQLIGTPELKQNTCLKVVVNDVELFNKYSSYAKLLRVVAYCRRVLPRYRRAGPLSALEIDEAETCVLKVLQSKHFPDVIANLRSNETSRKCRFANMSPFIDENGLLRVGGRLKRANISYAQKHPILLPRHHGVTDNIIRETHQSHYHTGILTTLYITRQKFWISDGRNQVRRVIRSCTRCFRYNVVPLKYKMGDLPRARVCQTAPFTHVGIDFCGPFYIKERKFRNQKRVKIYVCVFVCMTIKAVHLEIVSDLTTDGFIAAMRRLISRRGIPTHIYSDNGSNFIGANNHLRDLYVLLNSDAHKESVNSFASSHRIRWHFIPPLAPHFGGLWEAMVKLFKHHLKRVVGDSLFTFEEFNTFVIEIEGVLNSRPMTPISDDPNDLLVLTPAHYLIGRPITTLPEPTWTHIPDNRLSSWQHISKVRQDFWARWHKEYLNELQKRSKWSKDGPTLTTGTIVIVKDRNLPCAQWTLGRVTELHPGEDGVTRAATIRTTNGTIKRAANMICPLPIEQPQVSLEMTKL